MSARSMHFILLLATAIVLLVAGRLLAAAGTLDEPGVAMARDYPKADYDKVLAALKRKDVQYLGGHWLNSHTALKYAGETVGLNQFIEELSLCPNKSVRVMFIRPGPALLIPPTTRNY